MWAAACVIGFFWSFIACMRHWAFCSNAFDLGIFTNSIWNLSHGNGYYSSVKGGINLFSDHQSPIFWIFSPIFSLFPKAETLLIAQAFILAAGGPILYLLSKQVLYESSQFWKLAVTPLLYWSYLPLRNAVFFDFHPEVAMLPFFLVSIYWFQSLQPMCLIFGVLFFLMALSCKESAGVVAIGIGLSWIMGGSSLKKGLKWGFLFIFFGFLTVWFDLKKVPAFFGTTYAYYGEYASFGSSFFEILIAPFTKTGLFLKTLFQANRVSFFFQTLAPLAFLPVWNPAGFLAVIPVYGMFFLSHSSLKVQIIYHYGIEPAVGLFLALPKGMKYFHFSFLWILFWSFGMFGRSDLFQLRRHYIPSDYAKWMLQELLPALDPEIAYSSNSSIVPHLATRKWIGVLPDFRLPSQKFVPCVLLDTEFWHGMSQQTLESLISSFTLAGYLKIYSCLSLEIYALKGAQCMLREAQCPMVLKK